MKNWNIWFLVGILAVIYFGNSMIESINNAINKNTDTLMKLRAEAQAIGTQLQSDEKEKALFYKLQKNQDVWSGTGCAQCHSTLENSLPIRKISVSEAIQIVRNGNERTRAAGMPTYTARASRDKNSITDADLKVRLDALYTKEFLDYAEAKSTPMGSR
ncbi:hypothetical protein [Helicobacter canis]|uniref:Cytochrome c domain-containing protein n=1 Tax=Helicobacter canis NCTC 12740 TaxID=1357399 RepID=V8CKN6_9HELI|nr:hypothetical protein [Helicobacter canis]ETD27321.1 hypothetical protein HMPREF2087_00233 [Helicobacter canis NCTC 12740]